MARPRNLELARAVEEQVRAAGAVPATTALLDGRPHIGLTETQLERLAESRDAVKASRRDMAHVLASRGIGGTTVSGTMILADLANIRIFATGGIGGVHRGGETCECSFKP